ncbi:metallophosphoesterase family protein [Actinokineospora globicatena]|uniref:Metallophosphoesterase n=1 Tax=Actinokineospora globicatena TaxID=103729 RepID=A0A9W6QND3_9PSEU|nr:metallophosphoesterase [Actinokineospora globicatena]MCP2302528.1 putative phosphoesterase [Actinokineospora globicatena]GLW75785.1 metallophosphoesterase [Actinokineospora globicatena]GLW82625.1 metallophosphoesterase [Actinokineospora globicatena]GLW91573.1 metallophosphoesterase [Actinokineospora globicatena]
MRVHVVSDVHGNAEALARAGEGADALVVLGDLIDFVDYHDHSGGIMGRVFGPDKVGVFARLRRERKHGAAATYARELWDGLEDAAEVVEEAVRTQYKELFAAMSAPTYATPGNVDQPALWPEFVGDGVRVLDGEAVDIGGLRFGFVGGALLPAGAVLRPGAVFRPYLRTTEDFDAGVAALGAVDVLCSHAPPDVPELTYDVLARRAELGSGALLRSIREHRPRWAVFGHVHQPLAARVRVGWTECANVGHFQRTGRVYVLRW